MAETFEIQLLPGREGDCLLLAYGDRDRPRRMMIDAGRSATYRSVRRRLAALPADQRTLELLVVSHIDRDHIEGVLTMLADPERPVAIREVWFNGYHHLRDASIEAFGAIQGERLSRLLAATPGSWNASFSGASVELAHAPTPVELEGGLRLTLLAPDRADLEALIPEWDKECRKAGLVHGVDGWRDPLPPGYESMGTPDIDALADGEFESDASTANGASIIVLAEYGGRRALLAADGHSPRLVASLSPLAAASAGGRLAVDAFKLPHHGSRYNVSRDLLALVTCPTFLISTNGSYFDHPHAEAIARIVKYGGAPEIVFNYRSPDALPWDDAQLKSAWGYTTRFPTEAENGFIAVELMH